MPVLHTSFRSRLSPQETSSTAYKKGSSLIALGQDQKLTGKMLSNANKKNPIGFNLNSIIGRSKSPKLVSDSNHDIWADTDNTLSPSISSHLDNLRDNIDVNVDELTPCTTYSTDVTKTSSDGEFDDAWLFSAKKLLEIPELDQHHNQQQQHMTTTTMPKTETAVATENTSPYNQKVGGNVNTVGIGNHHPEYTAAVRKAELQGQQFASEKQWQVQSREVFPTNRHSFPTHGQTTQSNSTLQQVAASNRMSREIQQQQQHGYYDTGAMYGVPHHVVMQGHYSNATFDPSVVERRQDSSPTSSPTPSHTAPYPRLHHNTSAYNMQSSHNMNQQPMRSHYYQQQQNLHRHQPHSQVHPHSRNSYNIEPRSPHSNKYHQTHAQNWAQSPRSQTGTRSSSHAGPSSVNSSKQSHGHHQRSQQHPNTPSSVTNTVGPRPTFEVLKTLLRKKACLYEPDTSRTIALITWLVGRKLALEHGYFSRQHLQSGVHAVVGNKIDSGMITRTKVNRCMQIILNSCFHYIIPRPDGTEEKGDTFRGFFEKTVIDDSHLIKSLPHPWNDLKILDEYLVEKCGEDQDISEKAKDDSKRVVLLCFNENVRSAEDVLRCHNDFIRDASITGNLKLSADEWRQFFSMKSDDDQSHATGCTSESTRSNAVTLSPTLKPIDGCDIPYLTFDIPSVVSECIDFNNNVPEPWAKCADYLGQMNKNELSKFRTTWCCKRYEHDHTLCRFAHDDINTGWLRRNPTVHKYSDKLCPDVNVINSPNSALNGCYVNACKHGVTCKFAHSQEEVDYHPTHYKGSVCESAKNSFHSCQLRDICPRSHPESRSPSSASRHHHAKNLRNYGGKRNNEMSRSKGGHSSNAKNSPSASTASISGSDVIPSPSPILYHKPAPMSEFEHTLLFPGLQSLYRRNCAMHYAHHIGKKETLNKYSYFGDDCEDADHIELSNEVNSSSNFSLFGA